MLVVIVAVNRDISIVISDAAILDILLPVNRTVFSLVSSHYWIVKRRGRFWHLGLVVNMSTEML